MGGLEEVEGDAALLDWTLPEYDDSAWLATGIVQPVRDEYGQLTPWQLARRPIPLLYEREQFFLKLMRSSSGVGQAFLRKGIVWSCEMEMAALHPTQYCLPLE